MLNHIAADVFADIPRVFASTLLRFLAGLTDQAADYSIAAANVLQAATVSLDEHADELLYPEVTR